MARIARPLSNDLVRAIRLAAQGMANVPGAPVARVVARSGFVRTLGGAEAYLGVRARQRTMHRPALELSVDRGDLQVLPAVRGCIYLVPREDAALCLRIAARLSKARVDRELRRAGVTPRELAATAQQALATLRHGPLGTTALRKAMPEDAVRSLGDAGRKVGIGSTLPPALRELEFAGAIERAPEGGRLDTERYLWRVTAGGPFAAVDVPDDPVEQAAMLLERFVRWTGVATLVQFQAWSGLTAREARAAVPRSDVVPAAAVEATGTVLCSPHLDELLHLEPAVAHATAFLPFEDNLVHLFGGAGHLCDPEFLDLPVPGWGRGAAGRGDGATTLRTASHPALRPLIADGRLSGFWEYDPDAGVAVPSCFRTPSRQAQVLIEELSASTSAFLREELGHGRSFSLDTDDDLRRRLALLRTIGGAPRRRPARAAKVATAKAKAKAKARRQAADTTPAPAKKAPARTRPTNRR
ncbi:MAG: crosslink repair DNA glycosylase YcaQ family protein [Planctomycetota bacterium]